MSTTRTGSMTIGFRRGWGEWQRDVTRLIAFAKENDFGFLDFGPAPIAELEQVLSAGVEIGSVDLMDWKGLVSPDAARRTAAVQANIQYMREVSGLGVRLFLAVMQPEDPSLPRAENFGFAIEAYRALVESVASTGAKILLEGAPGPPPYHGSLGCTPADLRAIFPAIGSNALGVNFDPSHLVRMGIDDERFLGEFVDRIHHAHAKDVIFLPDGAYEHGNTQRATFGAPHRYGGHCWRYALPGRGSVAWAPLLSRLSKDAHCRRISIELEDEDFIGSDAAEQRGLIESRDFLARQ